MIIGLTLAVLLLRCGLFDPLRPWTVRSTTMLCGMLKGDFPARENKYGRMAIECARKGLGTFHPQINPAVLYS